MNRFWKTLCNHKAFLAILWLLSGLLITAGVLHLVSGIFLLSLPLIISGILINPLTHHLAVKLTKKHSTITYKLLTLAAAMILVLPIAGCCSTNDDTAILVSSNLSHNGGKELAPPSPVTLDLSSINSKIQVSWNSVDNATGYELYISEDGSKYKHLITTNETSYETEELTAGNTYYFRIKPYNSKPGWETVYGNHTDKSVTCIESNEIDGYEVGDTYVHIDIDQQMMWFYKNNKLLVETPIVTGTKGACDTPTGYFEVRVMASPAHLVGATWDVTTEYWIGINSANDIGIHDSSWRNTGYGGDIYTYSGSNGCINTPLDAMKTIYDNISVGTPVIVSGSVEISDLGDYGYTMETTPESVMESYPEDEATTEAVDPYYNSDPNYSYEDSSSEYYDDESSEDYYNYDSDYSNDPYSDYYDYE